MRTRLPKKKKKNGPAVLLIKSIILYYFFFLMMMMIKIIYEYIYNICKGRRKGHFLNRTIYVLLMCIISSTKSPFELSSPPNRFFLF